MSTASAAATDALGYQPLPEIARPKRMIALDVFRGATIAFMVLVNNPGGPSYAPLDHAPWNGWTPTDLVFPFFLFIVGVAIPFSQSKRLASQNVSRKSMLARIWLRALSLFMLGILIHSMPGHWQPLPSGFYMLKILHFVGYVFVYGSILALLIPWKWPRVMIWLPPIVAVSFFVLVILNYFALQHAQPWLPEKFVLGGGIFQPSRVRIPGVLQRIGICYGVAATIALYAGWRSILFAAIALMGIYAALMLKAPFPNHVTGSLTIDDNLQRRVDEAVLGKHNYWEYPDPEGILSTIPAIATPLLGMLVGLWLRSDRPILERCTALLAMGVIVTAVGGWMSYWMPINKRLWSPSYVVFTAGLAMLALGMLLWLIDIRGYRRWSKLLAILGMNAIVMYALSECLENLMGFITVSYRGETGSPLELLNHFYQSLPLTQLNASLLYALTFVAIISLIATLLYLLKIFIRV